MVENIYNNDRLKWPLLRDGEKGENKWKRITWEEAFDWLEDTYKKICKTIHDDYNGIGPEGIVALSGTGRNAMWHGAMCLRAVFGSPNMSFGFLSADSCYQPRMTANLMKDGDCWILDASQLHPDRYDNPEWKQPEVVIVWGNEPLASNPDGFVGHWLIDLMRMGTKFIVMDPALTWLASKADIWIQVRPGTDCALWPWACCASSSTRTCTITTSLTTGATASTSSVERLQDYPTDKVAEICWIPEQQIYDAARMFATAKPRPSSGGSPSTCRLLPWRLRSPSPTSRRCAATSTSPAATCSCATPTTAPRSTAAASSSSPRRCSTAVSVDRPVAHPQGRLHPVHSA